MNNYDGIRWPVELSIIYDDWKSPSLKIHTQGDFIGKNSLPLGHLFCDFVDYYDRHVILETFSRDWDRTEIYLRYETYCRKERLTYCIESES